MKRKNSKTKNLISCLLIAVCLALPYSLASPAAAAENVRLSMGAAATGTYIYMFCALVSEIWKNKIPNLDVTVMATSGSTANYLPIERREMDLGGASQAGDYYAMNGMYFTKEKLTGFSVLFPAAIAFTHTLIYADSPIKIWKDLDGKRVGISTRAAPTSIIAEETFKALEIKPKVVFATPNETIDMFKDRRIDAITYNAGAPWSGIMDAATNAQVKLVSLTPEEQIKIQKAMPYHIPGVLPAKTYAFQTEDVRLNTVYQHVIARGDMPADLVYKMTKVVWENWDQVVKSAPAAKWVSPKDILNFVTPVHPGAAKYYREIGIQIPDGQIWKKK
jgi:TRAP transporter TAXI family solute receptor